MLIIRSKQMDEMSRYMERRFEDRMATHLRAGFPEKAGAMSDEDLRRMIHEGTAKAAEYEVTDESDVERYLECCMRHGANFDKETEWAGEILRRDDLSGTEKMNAIDDYELHLLR